MSRNSADFVSIHGQPIGGGRASDIFDLGDGRVLRRFKRGGNAEREARVMRHARAHGYPVPDVFEVLPHGLVLERIDGPTMQAHVFRRPWTLARNLALLAELHERLHRIAAPSDLRALGEGDALLHLDLHPNNVLLSPLGPVVVDWANAHRGDGDVDVALAWLIMATSGGTVGRVAARVFLRHFDQTAVLAAVPTASDYRIADRNVTDAERSAIRSLVARVARA